MSVVHFGVKLLLLGIFSSTAVFLVSVAARLAPSCTLHRLVLCTTYPSVVSLVSMYLCVSFLFTVFYFFTDTDASETTFKKSMSMPWSLVISVAVLVGGYIILSGIS